MSAPRKVGCIGMIAIALFIVAALYSLGMMPGGPLE